jgi:hypothetical protein
MGKPEAPRTVEEILEDAALAFWVIVAESHPQAKSGDLSPGTTAYLKHAMREALVEWIRYNVTTEGEPGDVLPEACPYCHVRQGDDCQCEPQVKCNCKPPCESIAKCDAWECRCGNHVMSDGFYPCDKDGKSVDPTPELWKDDLIVCEACGAIIAQSTGKKISQRA